MVLCNDKRVKVSSQKYGIFGSAFYKLRFALVVRACAMAKTALCYPLSKAKHTNISLYIYICIYIYIYILEFTVATLPNSSPPLALRGGSAYDLYEWRRKYCRQKSVLLSAYLNFDRYLNFFDIQWPLMASEVKMT